MRMLIGALSSALLLGLAFAGSAAAGSFEPAPGAKFAMDLDTKDGNFSEWKLLDLGQANAARAKLSIHRLGQHEKWAPSFQLALGDGKSSVLIRFLGLPNGSLITTLEHIEDGKSVGKSEVFALGPVVDEVFDLDLDWTPGGVVTAIIHTKAAQPLNGFERHEVSLGRTPTWLRVIGSTGELEVQQLQVGRATP